MSAKKSAEGLVRAGETPAPEEKLFWWEGRAEYWELPFYADLDACCDAQNKREDELAGREQLWAMRELWDEGDAGPLTLLENKNNGENE